MSRPVVISALWPKNYPLLLGLVQRSKVDIAAPSSLLTPQVIGALTSAGARHIPLMSAEFAALQNAVVGDSDARAARISQALPTLASTSQGTTQTTNRTVELLSGRLPISLRDSMALVDELDALAAREDVIGVLVNETDLAMGRLVAKWAKARDIPSFLLSHGGNIGSAYTVTRCMLADYLLVFGTRGMETYLDIGIPAEQMIVTGNPAWDQYPSILAAREQYRTEVFTRLQLREHEPLVVFATIWNTHLTAIYDAQVFQDTVRGFLRGCKRLREMGTAFNVVFKDRPSNSAFGRDEIARLALEEDFTDYAYGIGDMEAYAVSADLLVSFDSNVLVEAMIAAVPCINLWTPSSWLVGPGYGSGDGIPMVQVSNPQALAEEMNAMLTDPSYRDGVLARMAAALPRFHLALDGASTARCVEAIAQRLKAPSPHSRLPINGAANGNAISAEHRLVRGTPRVALDIGGNGANAAALKKTNSHAIVHEFGAAEFLANPSCRVLVQPESVDTVLLTYALTDVRDPQALLRELRPLLGRDAQIVARVPNARNLWLVSELIAGRWNPAPGDILDPQHIRFFTLRDVLMLFDDAGYAVDRVEQVEDPRVPGIADVQSASISVETEVVRLNGMLASDVFELRSLDFLVRATLKTDG